MAIYEICETTKTDSTAAQRRHVWVYSCPMCPLLVKGKKKEVSDQKAEHEKIHNAKGANNGR